MKYGENVPLEVRSPLHGERKARLDAHDFVAQRTAEHRTARRFVNPGRRDATLAQFMPQVGVGLFDGEDFSVGVVFLLHATAAKFEKLLRILAVVLLDEIDEGQLLGGFEGDRRRRSGDLLLEFWEWGKRRHRFNVDRFEDIVVVTFTFDFLEGDFLIIFQLLELRLSLLNPQEKGVDFGTFI